MNIKKASNGQDQLGQGLDSPGSNKSHHALFIVRDDHLDDAKVPGEINDINLFCDETFQDFDNSVTTKKRKHEDNETENCTRLDAEFVLIVPPNTPEMVDFEEHASNSYAIRMVQELYSHNPRKERGKSQERYERKGIKHIKYSNHHHRLLIFQDCHGIIAGNMDGVHKLKHNERNVRSYDHEVPDIFQELNQSLSSNIPERVQNSCQLLDHVVPTCVIEE